MSWLHFSWLAVLLFPRSLTFYIFWNLTTAGGCFKCSTRGESRISARRCTTATSQACVHCDGRLTPLLCFLSFFVFRVRFCRQIKLLSWEMSFRLGRSSIPVKHRFTIHLAESETLADKDAKFCQFMSPYQISANQSLEQHKRSYLHVIQTVKIYANRTVWLES